MDASDPRGDGSIARRRVRLVLLGPHTRVVAELCAVCPSGALGCCSQPPDLSWADIGRIASLGGARFLVEEIAAGRLVESALGLHVKRIAAGAPFDTKCVYHGEGGCTIGEDRRSAACNYYVCNEALETVGEDASSVEAAMVAWTSAYHGYNEALSIDGKGPVGERLFEELGSQFAALSGRG